MLGLTEEAAVMTGVVVTVVAVVGTRSQLWARKKNRIHEKESQSALASDQNTMDRRATDQMVPFAQGLSSVLRCEVSAPTTSFTLATEDWLKKQFDVYFLVDASTGGGYIFCAPPRDWQSQDRHSLQEEDLPEAGRRWYPLGRQLLAKEWFAHLLSILEVAPSVSYYRDHIFANRGSKVPMTLEEALEANLDLEHRYKYGLMEATLRQYLRANSPPDADPSSWMAYVNVSPEQSVSFRDLMAQLCARVTHIPLFRPGVWDDFSYTRPSVWNNLQGWQVLLYVVLPVLRLFYGLPPPEFEFGYKARLDAGEQKDIDQLRSLAQLQNAGAAVFPGPQSRWQGIWGESAYREQQDMDTEEPVRGLNEAEEAQPPQPPARQPLAFNDNPRMITGFMNPVPNRRRLNPPAFVGSAQNPQYFQQDQADNPRLGYRGRAEQFTEDEGRPMDDQPRKDRRLESRKYKSAGRAKKKR